MNENNKTREKEKYFLYELKRGKGLQPMTGLVLAESEEQAAKRINNFYGEGCGLNKNLSITSIKEEEFGGRDEINRAATNKGGLFIGILHF